MSAARLLKVMGKFSTGKSYL